MIEYVNGFLFDNDLQMVVLVQKNRPAFQAGLWNGVGGKLEADETPAQAMTREFREETGVNVENWIEFAKLGNDGFVVHFFCAITDTKTQAAVKTTTDENIGIWMITHTVLSSFKSLPNLRWLLPMAMVAAEEKNSEYFYNVILEKR